MLTGLTAFWLDADRGRSCPTTSSRTPTCRTRCAAAACSSSGSRWCRSSASCAATSPARAGRTTRPPARSAGSSCRPACSESEQLPGADLHARHQGRAGRPRRERGLRPRRRDRGRPRRCSRSCAGSRSRSTSTAPAHARERGIILADTKFEFGRRADGTIVLGDEVLTPDSSRFWPADGYEPGRSQPSFDKQFVRDWAAELGLGQVAARAAAAGRGGGGHPRALPRGLRADHRRALQRLAGALRRRDRAGPDPAEGGHPRPAGPGGGAGAARARVRRRVATCRSAGSIELDGRRPGAACREMCERLLANPLIEDYEVVVLEDVAA